jgi:hypothetical protein
MPPQNPKSHDKIAAGSLAVLTHARDKLGTYISKTRMSQYESFGGSMPTLRIFSFTSIALISLAGAFSLQTLGTAAAQSPEAPSLTAGPNTMSGQITAKEHEILDDLKNGEMQSFAALTADEALAVDSHGAHPKIQRPQKDSNYQLKSYTIENIRFIEVAPDTGLITYKLTKSGTLNSKPFTTKSYVSSLWITRGGNRVRLFTQETPTPDR